MSYNQPGIYSRVNCDSAKVKHVMTSKSHAMPLSAVLKGNVKSSWDPSQFLKIEVKFELPIEFLKKGS